MFYRLQFLNFVTATLLLSVASPLLPLTSNLKPLVVQAQTTQDRKAEAERLFHQGDEQASKLQYQAAIPFYQQALKIYQEIRDRPGEAHTLNDLGVVYRRLKQYQRAIELYQQSLAIKRELRDQSGEANSLMNLHNGYKDLNQYGQAIKFGEQGLVILKELGYRALQARALISLGSVYRRLGNYEQALSYNQQSLVIYRELRDLAGEAAALANLGNVYLNLGGTNTGITVEEHGFTISNQDITFGYYNKALEYHQQSLAISRKIGERQGEALSLGAIGTVYLARIMSVSFVDDNGQILPPSLTMSTSSQDGSHFQTSFTLSRSQHDSNFQENLTKAIDYFQQYLTITREIGNRYGESVALSGLGFAYREAGEDRKAIEIHQQSLAIARELNDRDGEASSLSTIASILVQQNKPELAIIFYKQSVNITESIRSDLGILPIKQQKLYTQTIAGSYRALADLLLKQDRVLEAQRVLDLLKVQELQDYLRNVRGNNNTTQGLPNLPPEEQFNQGYEALVNKAVTLGKELTQLEKIPEQNRTPAQQQRVIELRNTQQKILAEYDSFIHSPAVETIVQQLTQTAKRQNLDLEDLNSLQSNLKQLNQNAVLLYPLILNDRLELVLLTADSPPIHRAVPVKREDLNRAIAQFRTALENPSSDAKTPAHQLYDWLIKPIENDLTQANAQTIIYAPDAQLRYIPLAALHDGKQWLVQRFRVNNITARSLKDINTQPQVKPHVLAGAFTKGSYRFKLGNQEFSFNGLPFAAREVETLAATVPGTTQLLDQAFSRDETVLRMNDYNIIHLATHAAFVTGQPKDSFVLFGDGHPATLENIKKWSLPNVDLIVLSACETGLGGFGNGQEILGFGYLMEKAGARSAIASLWSVDDGGTQALMNAFYTALKKGMSKAEALRQAQTALITKDLSAVGGSRGEEAWIEVVSTRTGLPKQVSNNLSHPHYWAPFILIGNGL